MSQLQTLPRIATSFRGKLIGLEPRPLTATDALLRLFSPATLQPRVVSRQLPGDDYSWVTNRRHAKLCHEFDVSRPVSLEQRILTSGRTDLKDT